jgi:glutamyl-tRNA reductase
VGTKFPRRPLSCKDGKGGKSRKIHESENLTSSFNFFRGGGWLGLNVPLQPHFHKESGVFYEIATREHEYMPFPSPIFVLGINHQTAPVAVREQLSFSDVQLREALNRLTCCDGIAGGVILSTCNRSEIYVSSHSSHVTHQRLKQFLSDVQKVDLNDLSPYMYSFENRDVIKHLYRVSSGLDSQLLGENEILGQVKRAFGEAKAVNASDVTLQKLFDGAIKMGKKVRRETNINHGSTSLSSMAIKLAEKEVSLQDKTILLVGVNKINEQIAGYLYERNIHTVIVANRTYQKALTIAQYLGGRAIHFDTFKKELDQVDIIISSTAAPHFILKKREVEASLKKRKRSILLIDMAVPRDIDPDCKQVAGITLYSLDDFNQVIKENLGKKRKEALKAERLIKQAVESIELHASPI